MPFAVNFSFHFALFTTSTYGDAILFPMCADRGEQQRCEFIIFYLLFQLASHFHTTGFGFAGRHPLPLARCVQNGRFPEV